MPSENEMKAVLMGLAAHAGRIGVRAGLAALDSALGDVERGARNVEKRVAKGRKRVAEALDDLLNPLRGRAGQEEEEDEGE